MPPLQAGEPDRCERGPRPRTVAAHAERNLLVRPLRDEVAPRILRQVAGAPVPEDAASLRLQEAGGELRERRLPRAVRPDEHDDLAATQLELDAVEQRHVRSIREGDALEPANRLDPTLQQSVARRSSTCDPRRSFSRQPLERALAGSVEEHPSAVEEDDAVGALEGEGEPLLGADDGDAEPTRPVEERAGGARVELRGRLVEEQEPRLEGERRGQADALELAAGEPGDRARRQVPRADGGERACNTAGDLARRRAEVLEAEGDLVLDARHDDLVLRILEERGHGAGEIGWPVRAGVQPRHGHRAREAAAVEVRNEPREGAEQGRLPRAGGTEQHDELSGLDRQRHVLQSRATRVRVGEGEPLDAS